MPSEGIEGQRQHDPRPGDERSNHNLHLRADRRASDCRDHDLGPNQSDRRMTPTIRRSQWIGVGGANRTTGISLKRTTRFSNDDLRLGHEDEAHTRLGQGREPAAWERGEHVKGECHNDFYTMQGISSLFAFLHHIKIHIALVFQTK